MTKLNYYESVDFIEIENGEIHWLGYFYESDHSLWRVLQYRHFYTSLKDFVDEYNNDPAEAYETEGVDCTQYISAMEDDPETYTEEWFENELDGWLENAIHIDPEDITTDTPDGIYVLIKEPFNKEEN